MTPLEISILLHYYCSGTDFRDGDFSAPAVREAIDRFKENGSLQLSTDDDNMQSILVRTDKTCVYVEALCAVPEAVQRWIIPGGNTP